MRQMKTEGRRGASLMLLQLSHFSLVVSLTILAICTALAGQEHQQDLLDPPESFTLLQLKSKLNDSLGNLWSWDSRTTTPCDGFWIGVGCDIGRFHVISVNLTGQNLSGTIDGSSLLFLRHLEIFILSNNELTGGIPKQLGEMFSLSVVDLSSNLLTGTIPSELGLLPNLTELILSNNNLVGEIPTSLGGLNQLNTLYVDLNSLGNYLPVTLANCSALAFVDFSYNYVVGGIPKEFGRLLQLQELMGRNNRLDGEIPSELGNCSLLWYIGLPNNGLEGSIPKSLGNLSAILALDLFNNRLSGSIPASLCNLENISQLQLHNNSLGGSIPSCLGELPLQNLKLNGNMLNGRIPRNFSSLVKINLCDNYLTGQIPPEFGEISSLSDLILYNNKLTGPIPASLGRNGSLTILDIGWNALTGKLPATICNTGLLEKIVVQSNGLSGELPASIGNCRSLRRLLLAENEFEGSLPVSLGELSESLYYVDMTNNKLSGSLPYQIGGCSNISALLLSQNLFEGTLPEELGNLTRLEEFDISNNILTGAILPSTFRGCSLIFRIDLSFNKFSGSIPREFGALKQLEILMMHNNFLSGSIPEELGACHALRALDLGNNQLGGVVSGNMLGNLINLQSMLNLSHNALSGMIPGAVGNLVNLEALDLSYNRLDGKIPSSFASLASILHLNLSYNNLSGTIPHTATFSQISADSYLGNPGLVCVFNGTRPSSLINDCTVDGNPIVPGSNILRNRGRGKFPSSPTDWVIVVVTSLMPAFFFIAGCIWWNVWLKSKALKKQEEQEAAVLEAAALPNPDVWDEFTAKEIIDATRNLDEDNVIGRGGFGTVYKAFLESGEVLAVKKLDIDHDQQSTYFESYLREIHTAGRIRHRNIVRLYGYCKARSVVMIIYKYIANGSLGDLLHRKQSPIDFQTRFKIGLGTAYGISYLHSDCVPMIVHRDIKSNNILLDEDMEPYLTDFGVAKLMLDSSKESMSVIAGSIGYIAPEYCYTTKVTEKSDVYSFGVVLLELLTRMSATSKAFPDGTDLVHWARRNLGSISAIVAPDAEDECLPFDIILPTLDPELQSTTDPRRQFAITQMFTVALICTNLDPVYRPTMSQVIILLLRAKEAGTL